MPTVPGSGRDHAVAADEARDLAERLATDLPALTDDMFEFLAAQIDEIGVDRETRDLTRASIASNLEAGLSMMRHRIPAERTEAPVAALEHARHMAARGMGIDATVRFYRLGHAHFWQRWVAAIGGEIRDPDRLSAVLEETAAFTFAYIDAISAKVSVELLAERDRRERRITAQREDLVAAILAGDDVDLAGAERMLGFALGRPHVAFVCWTEGDPAELEPAAARFAATFGTSRPLLITESGSELSGWLHVDGAVPPQPAVAPAGHVALGSPASGPAGFRASHDQARRAQRIARLARLPAPSLTRFEDVSHADLLSRDLPAARAFVEAELGRLAGADERSTQLRGFLLAYLAAGSNSTATAAALGLHRNTTRQRLARAEELRGLPVTQRAHELRAALVLADTLGDAALPDR